MRHCAPAVALAFLLGAGAALGGRAIAEESRCINAKEHERLQRMYDRYQARYGLAVVAQQLLDFDNAQRALAQQLAACRKSAPPADAARCEALARQIEARSREQDALADRFNAALDLQLFLATLELRLQQPVCRD